MPSDDSKRVLGIKIDVDTYHGMKEGVPRLLNILGSEGIKGTFFLSIGPDSSGRAALQLIKNTRFLKKMVRTNAVGLYGLRTALYGTVLPSPMIALSFPTIVQEIMDQGHEVQFHAWDHRRWQDELLRKPAEWIRDWFERGIGGFVKLTGRHPTAFGAPAWMIDDRVMAVLKDYSFDYLSCTRARKPFIHEGIEIIEIPSDLPCFEEVGVPNGISIITEMLRDGGTHVFPAHAEAEGGVWSGHFISLLAEVKKAGYSVTTLSEVKKQTSSEKLEVRKYRIELLPGRSVPCAV
ncbi:MAG TPA: polysaccharide deacetylase family protein [Syntrophales bacterium]|nr:polysaccharide deacetylase family protein [Syntrophales bacterium]